MMATSRDFNERTEVKLRYAILSVPRSGSTLLSRALYETRMAGDPHEYLNPAAIAVHQEASGAASMTVDAYLREIEARRTSSNGYFGIKVHYFHLSRLCDTVEKKLRVATHFLRQQDRRVLITRRDKIAQAISYYIARQSGRWTSEHERHLQTDADANVSFDPVAIARCLQRIIEDEDGWRRALSSAGLPYLEIFFEDFVTSYRVHMEKVFPYLGLDSILATSQPAMAPTTSIQAKKLGEQFRRYLALG